jgi:hypothetical protein
MALDVPAILVKLAQRHNKKFIFQGKTLELEKVFDWSGALFVFVKRANLLADFLFGRKLMLSIVPDHEALSGEKVVMQAEESAFIVVMLLYDVLEEMVQTATGDEIVLS